MGLEVHIAGQDSGVADSPADFGCRQIAGRQYPRFAVYIPGLPVGPFVELLKFHWILHHIEQMPVFVEGELLAPAAVVLVTGVTVHNFFRSEFPENFIGIGITDRPQAWKQRRNH